MIKLKNNTSAQPWIYNAGGDLLFVLAPPFICLLLIVLFPSVFNDKAEETLWSWVILVLCIDVAHVYSTLFRTYFEKDTFKNNKAILVNIPLVGWIIFVLLYSFSSLLFWRVLAYLAVFHFIRQQYGFLRIYSRNEKGNNAHYWIDTLLIYLSTIYPILYWHTSNDKMFHWFVKNDFFYFNIQWPVYVCGVVYGITMIAYVVKEMYYIGQTKTVNWPKNLLIVGTALSWYIGIVYFDGDLTFTLLNVVSHGIPYMALVWFYGRKKYSSPSTAKGYGRFFTLYGVVAFVGVLIFLAWLEEGMWDAMIWQEHKSIFDVFSFLPSLNASALAPFLVPLLALPQITHYILDGFIWKMKKDTFDWRNMLNSK